VSDEPLERSLNTGVPSLERSLKPTRREEGAMQVLLDGAVVVGVLLVVPLGARQHGAHVLGGRSAAVVVGVLAATGVLLGRGVAPALAWLPLVVWAAATSLRSLLRWWQVERALVGLASPVAFGYLAVAGVWAIADRLSLEPLGFAWPYVALTAIHFLYAGFASTTIGWLVQARAPGRWRTAAVTGLVATAAGPPLVAAGFTLVEVLLTVGAVVLTLGLYLVAAAAWFAVAPQLPRRSRLALRVAAAAVVVPMLLAVHWAAGATFGFASLSVPMMARTHGVVNALGFVLPALAAFTWAAGAAPRLGPSVSVSEVARG
jgi:hypothetical protein